MAKEHLHFCSLDTDSLQNWQQCSVFNSLKMLLLTNTLRQRECVVNGLHVILMCTTHYIDNIWWEFFNLPVGGLTQRF